MSGSSNLLAAVNELPYELTAMQNEAVLTALNNTVSCITGAQELAKPQCSERHCGPMAKWALRCMLSPFLDAQQCAYTSR